MMTIMYWFVIALITPLAHAFVNHIDKHILSKYFKGGSPGALALFASLFAIVALPIIFFIDPAIFSINFHDALILILNGSLLGLAYICYFYALQQDEASLVAPLFQMTPIFAFILGFIVLGERIPRPAALAGLLILIGAIVISIDITSTRFKIKESVFFLMMGSSLFYAINSVLFKFVAVDQQRFWPSLFWNFVGQVILGIIIFYNVKSYRKKFLGIFKKNALSVLLLNSLSESLVIIGEGALIFATLLAPVALVQVVSGFQPVFVLIIGFFLTIFIPKLGKESLSAKSLAQKLIGIGLIVAGTVFLGTLGAL